MKSAFLRRYALLLVAGIAVIATAAQVLRNDLVWDDEYLISTADEGALGGGIAAAIGSPFWKNSSYVASDLTDYWRPLTKALLWLGRVAFDKAPWGLHLVSLLAAIGAALALSRLICRALGAGRPEARRVGLWLGLAFLAHPLCAEVLCLAANVSDHLVLLFLAIEVVAFHDYQTRGGGVRRLVVAAVAGFLACSSKETGVVAALAPLAAFLIRAASDDSVTLRTVRRAGPWIAAVVPVAIYLALRAAVMSGDGGSANPFSDGFSLTILTLGFGQLLLRAFCPAPQGAMITLGPGHLLVLAAAGIAWILLAAKITVDVVRRRRLSLVVAGGLLAIALLAPSAAAPTLLQEANAIATRYLTLPLAGLLLGVAGVLLGRWGRGAEIALAAAVALLCLLSWVRIGEWRTEVSFFSAELAYHPESEFARVNLAQELCQAHAFDAAEKVLRPLAGTDHHFASQLSEAAYDNVRAKIAAFRDGDIEAATRILEGAVRRAPADLVNVLMLAEARDRAGRPDQSLIITEKALAAPWFQDHRRAVILKYLDLYRGRAAEAAERKAP